MTKKVSSKTKTLKNKVLQYCAGFSLVEIIIVIALAAALSTSSFLFLDQYVSRRSVDTSIKQIEAVISDVRKRSVAQEEGLAWGINFVNSDSDQYYEIFSGSSYATSSVIVKTSLSNRAKFSSPAASSSITVFFEPITGNVATPVTIAVIPKRGEAYVGIIRITPLGNSSREILEDMVSFFSFDDQNSESTSDLVGLTLGAYGDDDDSSPGEVPIQYASGSSCKSGSCIYLSDYFLQGNFINNLRFDQFTVMAWVKLSGNGNYGSILTGLEDTKEWFDARFQASSRKPQFRTYSGEDMSDNNAVSVGVWYHLAYVYDGTQKLIYKNGVMIESEPKSGLSFDLNQYDIGRSEEKDNYLLEGYLDELKLFSKALSAEEIMAEYSKLL